MLYMFEMISLSGLSEMVMLMAAIMFLWICEKRLVARVICIYAPVIMFFGIWLNPVSQDILSVIMVERTEKYLWLIQYYIIIAYAFTKLLYMINARKKRCICMLMLIIMLGCTGMNYVDWNLERNTNIYKINNEIIEVAQIIQDDGGQKKLIATTDISTFIRMYDGDIELFYARGNWSPWWGHFEVAEFVNSDEVNVSALTDIAKTAQFVYIVCNKSAADIYEMDESGYTLLNTTASYDIYRVSAEVEGGWS